MANVQSYTKADIRDVIREHERELKTYKNKVNLALSYLNYGYGVQGTQNIIDKFNSRAKEVMQDKKLQKQTNLMCEWDIYCPVELIGKQEKEFFDTFWNFCKERYGSENVISGKVHMDETTPHMHLDLIPVCKSRKTGRETVSSASLLTRTELQTFHKDFDRVCQSVFGVKGLVNNGNTLFKGSNITSADFQALKDLAADQVNKELKAYKAYVKHKGLEEDFKNFCKPKAACPYKPVEAPKSVENDFRVHKSKKTGKQPLTASESPKNDISNDIPKANTGIKPFNYIGAYKQAKRAIQAEDILSNIKRDTQDDFSLDDNNTPV